MSQIRKASVMTDEELFAFAKEIQAPFHLLETARVENVESWRLLVVNFAAGGIATPGMFS
jgi:pyridoxal 5'-phosphate synthase pdxS subunit